MSAEWNFGEERRLSERLELYARYLSVVAEELQAIETGDFDRISPLRTERSELEDRLGGAQEEMAALPDRLEDLLSLGLSTVQDLEDASHEMEERWESLDTSALRSARRMGRSARRAGRYPDGNYTVSSFNRTL